MRREGSKVRKSSVEVERRLVMSIDEIMRGMNSQLAQIARITLETMLSEYSLMDIGAVYVARKAVQNAIVSALFELKPEDYTNGHPAWTRAKNAIAQLREIGIIDSSRGPQGYCRGKLWEQAITWLEDHPDWAPIIIGSGKFADGKQTKARDEDSILRLQELLDQAMDEDKMLFITGTRRRLTIEAFRALNVLLAEQKLALLIVPIENSQGEPWRKGKRLLKEVGKNLPEPGTHLLMRVVKEERW